MDLSVSVREGYSADAADIVRLLDQLGYPKTDDFIKERLLQLISHPDAVLLVAISDDKDLVGFIAAHFIPQLALRGDFCRISYFCVDRQSRSMGVGWLLEETIVEAARQRGCDRIEVHCHSRRDRAHHFYHRQGYIESPKYLVKTLTS